MTRGRRPLARLAAAMAAAVMLAGPACAQRVPGTGEVVRGASEPFRVSTFSAGLERPWGAAFLPDGRLLVTERPGRMRIVSPDGTLSPPLGGVPEVLAAGQGGLLDVQPAPDFATTRELYFCQAAMVQGDGGRGAATRLVRARLSADARHLEMTQPILDALPAQSSGRLHYGCRIAFGRDGKLYLSTGDRHAEKMRAQRLDDLAGKVLRLERDGRPAEGNPFLGRPDARPEIFTYGHRNPQGLALNPWTGSLWEAEFGARGGDEVNLLKPGLNYGWPIVTHGVDYDGSRIGEGSSRPDMEEPLRYWVPSVSPSGIGFYDGEAFPGWKGSLFMASLNTPGLLRLSTDGDRITGEERLLWGELRFRQVLQGPDGLIYILTDEGRGRILRLEPVAGRG
ncbi:PQQ-dependent sugar dehydrogenase [Roseomonas marmotae]|uniref:PQQ-dependent sugar dehydrogenase n=1 Tax=Roseomonas marmotae TaxID=2768161 RepID=A0ABS3KHW3_9PROT|nr:PQQ-dependent sugar dehydrogenase [Roseomonas marmotae]MBO1076592.1 PQQ-dependent sugar dehydrogenase [Roseomonas marmotae]QTI79576.1 PQQ-dependent sugar dehydrogenase [Roseomonas marmotae]